MTAPAGLTDLLSLAGPALGPVDATPGIALPEVLRPLWGARNGWEAYWSALQVFPLGAATAGLADVASVNAVLAEAFGSLAAGHVAFGQDLFGVLMTWHEDHVCGFDPETAEHEPIADDLDLAQAPRGALQRGEERSGDGTAGRRQRGHRRPTYPGRAARPPATLNDPLSRAPAESRLGAAPWR